MMTILENISIIIYIYVTEMYYDVEDILINHYGITRFASFLFIFIVDTILQQYEQYFNVTFVSIFIVYLFPLAPYLIDC